MDDEKYQKRTDAEIIASIKKLIEELKGYRFSSFPALKRKPGAKLVRVVAVSKNAFAYRLVDIADAALDMFISNRLVPGNILARSALETVAGVHMLKKRISEVEKVEQFDGLVNFFSQILFGSRDQSSKYKSLSALTMVDHLHKNIGLSGINTTT